MKRRKRAATASGSSTREVYRWAAAREASDAATAAEERLGLRVRKILGPHAIGELTTGEIVSYKTTSDGKRILWVPKPAKGKR